MTASPRQLDPPPSLKQERRASVIAAFASGTVLFPIACFVGLIIAYGHTNVGSGNVIFWGTVLAGSVGAALGVFYSKRGPIWLAAISGLVVVLGAFSLLTIALFVAGVI